MGIKKHGESCRYGQTPEYRAWIGMRQRCYNPTNRKYHRYGGRGIRVCKRWRSYELFRKDVGSRPSPKHTLERLDNNGDYEPKNVVWATNKQQSRNRSDTVMFTMFGRTQCLVAWAEEYGITKQMIYNRHRSGMSLEEAVITPRMTPGKPRLRKRRTK